VYYNNWQRPDKLFGEISPSGKELRLRIKDITGEAAAASSERGGQDRASKDCGLFHRLRPSIAVLGGAGAEILYAGDVIGSSAVRVENMD